MKKWKVILALLLAAAIVCMLLAACAKQAGTADTPAPSGGDSPADPDSAQQDHPSDEMANIVVSYLDVSANETDEWDRLEAYINTITEPQGIHVKLQLGQMSDYGTQIPLMIAGGEQLDVINISPMGTTNLPGLLGTNSLLDCSELLATYAPGALEVVGDLADVYRKGDALYGLPTNRINASNEYLILRKDILDATGTLEQAQNLKTWSDVEALFAAVYDYCTENSISVIGGQKSCIDTAAFWHSDELTDNLINDNLGERANILMTDESGHVLCKWDYEDLVNMQKRAVTWEQNGWVYPDTILGDDHTDNLYKQGVLFAYHNHTEIGVETARKLSSGYDVVCPMLAQGVILTSNLTGFGVGIPTSSEEPEAAAKFINMLYTDSRIVTVFAWGVEGEDYVMNDQNEAVYPEPRTTSYHGQDYMFGNQMLVPAWEGQGSDFRARADEFNKTVGRSPYLGISLDTKDLQTTIASITSVNDEFLPALNSGHYTDELHQQYIDKLYSVGMQEYIDAIQAQLDAFLAEK